MHNDEIHLMNSLDIIVEDGSSINTTPSNNTDTTSNNTNTLTDTTDREMDSVQSDVVDESQQLSNTQLVLQSLNEINTYREYRNNHNDIQSQIRIAKQRSIERLCNIVKYNKDLATYMHVQGLILLPDSEIRIKNILMDTGALHGSYVSTNFIEKHRQLLSGYIHKGSGKVKFGNDNNIRNVTEVLILPIKIACKYTKTLTTVASVFTVVELSNDFIIGLPDLADTLSHVFVKAFSAAAQGLQAYKDKTLAFLAQ